MALQTMNGLADLYRACMVIPQPQPQQNKSMAELELEMTRINKEIENEMREIALIDRELVLLNGKTATPPSPVNKSVSEMIRQHMNIDTNQLAVQQQQAAMLAAYQQNLLAISLLQQQRANELNRHQQQQRPSHPQQQHCRKESTVIRHSRPSIKNPRTSCRK